VSKIDDLQLQFQEQIEEYLSGISGEISNLFKEAIEESVYNASDGLNTDFKLEGETWWERSEDFLNAVDITYDDNGSLIIFVNTDKLDYYSYVAFTKTEKNASEIVPWLLEEGHSSSKSNQYGMYSDYKGRHYLELAKQKVQEEFPGLLIEIINEEPDHI
jgi:hypothetical protein